MITPGQILAARKLVGWTPSTLARKTKITIATIDRMEKHGNVTIATYAKMQSIFEQAGVEFGLDGQVKLK